MNFSTVSVIGLGYIGLPTAAILASRKVKVLGIDISEVAVNTINQGKIHIVEPELDILVHSTVTAGYLRAAISPQPADVFLIAVPTPFKANHEPDLGHIHDACRSIAPVLKPGNLVILESTSPVGATEQMAEWLAQERPDLSFPQQAGENSDIRIAHCPERVLPGQVLRELVENDRIVGGMTPRCAEVAATLYGIFVQGDCIITDTRTAEMCKLTENAFRDVNIAFANELSLICDQLKIDVWELIRLANFHPRVNILQPSCGVGGHCIAVDPWFIVSKTPESARLIQAARNVNDQKPTWVVGKVEQAVAQWIENGKASNKVQIACLGLSFKPDIDDLRESPAVHITQTLAQRYPGQVIAVEPHIKQLPTTLSSAGVRLLPLTDALRIADVVVLLVDHRVFKAQLPPLITTHVVVDTRGIIKPTLGR